MNFEITVGRETSGQMDILVPSNYSKVSRKHAKIVCTNSQMYIEDLNSANGSYINGRRVSKKELHPNDIIFMGSKDLHDSFQLPVSKIIDDVKKLEHQQKTDYTEEFKTIIRAYNQFKEEKTKIKSKSQQKNQMPKLMITISIAVVLLIVRLTIQLPRAIQNLMYPIMMLTTAIGGFLSMTGGSKNDISEDLVDLELKYQNDYKCPKCGKNYNLNMHWKKLAKDKKCPHGCGAVFIR